MSNANKQIDSFFDKVEERVVQTQKNIIASAMGSLFAESPHYDDAPYAKGEYDSNHKISINNSPLSRHNLPSRDKEASRARHMTEGAKANSIKLGDQVRITNTTEHAGDVEKGGPTWGRPGYRVYTNTSRFLRDEYSDVIE